MSHLAVHPAAADSAEGIRVSWLGGAASAEEVEEALGSLVAAGEVAARLLPDGTILFTRAAPRAE